MSTNREIEPGKLVPHAEPAAPQPNGPDLPPPISEPLKPEVLSKFRLDGTNFTEAVHEVVTTILVTQPPKSEFIRVQPDASLVTYTIRTKKDHYLIDPAAFSAIKAKVPDFEKHASAVTLRPYVTRAGLLALWPLKMENPYSVGTNSWNISAFNVAKRAETHWLRVSSDQATSLYVVHEPEMSFPDPVWPAMTIDEMVDLASRVNVVDSIDHPFIRALRGLPPG
jgi:hypothetical protein